MNSFLDKRCGFDNAFDLTFHQAVELCGRGQPPSAGHQRGRVHRRHHEADVGQGGFTDFGSWMIKSCIRAPTDQARFGWGKEEATTYEAALKFAARALVIDRTAVTHTWR